MALARSVTLGTLGAVGALVLALTCAGSASAQEPTPTPTQPTIPPPRDSFLRPGPASSTATPPATPSGQGIAVLAIGPARDEAFALARAVYGSRLRPTSLDEVRARVLAGAPPPPNASRELRELAEVRAGITTEDAAARRLLTGLAQQVGAQALLVVKVDRGAALPSTEDAGADAAADAGNAAPATTVVARLFLTDSGDFDAARYAPDPGLEGAAAWRSTVTSLEARFPPTSRVVGPNAATVGHAGQDQAGGGEILGILRIWLVLGGGGRGGPPGRRLLLRDAGHGVRPNPCSIEGAALNRHRNRDLQRTSGIQTTTMSASVRVVRTLLSALLAFVLLFASSTSRAQELREAPSQTGQAGVTAGMTVTPKLDPTPIAAPRDVPQVSPSEVAIPRVPSTYITRELGWLSSRIPAVGHRARRVAPAGRGRRSRRSSRSLLGQPVLGHVEVRITPTFDGHGACSRRRRAPPPAYASGVAYPSLRLVIISMLAPRGADGDRSRRGVPSRARARRARRRGPRTARPRVVQRRPRGRICAARTASIARRSWPRPP